jgi:peptide/nickel transport system substrate-binding protein
MRGSHGCIPAKGWNGLCVAWQLRVNAMNERELRGMIAGVKSGRRSRRWFIARMLAAGIIAPAAMQLLTHSGIAMAQTPTPYPPKKRGGGGTLKVLWWQGPTLLNPHFAVGTKDQDGSRIFYEPLAAWDGDGNLRPILAAEIPSLDNGGLAKDGMSVTWKLKQGVTWHDGTPFTADDVVFNWEYSSDPATATVTTGSYNAVKVEKIDQLTVRVLFPKPTVFWADAFVGQYGMIIPKHLFSPYTGAKSREAPNNLKPVGTGPYMFKEFRPGDLVTGTINPTYHQANKPYFDAIEMKGGGDAVSAARAVLQTGEYDFAWNLQVEDDVLLRLEKGGKGHVIITEGAGIEHIQLNSTDPWTEVDGERASVKTKHPSLGDTSVRKALALLVDRDSVQKYIYGRTGIATANYVNNPKKYTSTNLKWEFNIDKANALLDAGGWVRGSDGVRAKGGVKLKYVFQSSINQPRQKTQAIVKQACQKAGIEIEIKSVTASVFFSSDVGNPDTYPHFYADLQMYNTSPGRPDPALWLQCFLSTEKSSKANKWQGRNITRWESAEFDRVYRASEEELDPVKRTVMLIQLNDLPVSDNAVIPVVYRPSAAGINNKLHLTTSGWDNDTWDLASWYMDT